MSGDLIDFNFKPAENGYRYILVIIDNFSRCMYTEPLTAKKPKQCADAMRKILRKIKSEFKGEPNHILVDDGGEFKGEFIGLLQGSKIRKQRTIGGHPEANGAVHCHQQAPTALGNKFIFISIYPDKTDKI